MARSRTTSRARPLPPPLPPERRTIGQLVGESMRLYGANFWKALALGVPVAVVDVVVWTDPWNGGRVVALPVSVLLFPLSYVAASALVTRTPLRTRRALLAYGVAVAVFIPFPLLAALFVLPGLVWLALFGLAVPALLAEGLGARVALGRGLRLARADFVHALGGLATLVLVVLIAQAGLFFVLREFADNTRNAAAVLASLVVTPLVFLGSALLYVDQEARLRSRANARESRKERDADLPDADDAHRQGREDASREPESAPRGQP